MEFFTTNYDGLVYSSTNSDIVTIDSNGNVDAKENGTAEISASITVDEIQSEQAIPVTVVSEIEYDGLSSSRTATGIALARIPETIEVGEEFVAQAYILSDITDDHPYPYGYSDDNIVRFVSSNPAVCRVKNGVLFGVSTGTATITVTDITETVSETFDVEVVAETALDYTDAEILNVTEAEHDWSTAETTTLEIISILSQAAESGMKKVIFPNRIYEISPAYGTITVPTNMILDFSGGILQIVESAMTQTGYQMVLMQDVEHSSIENAVIYGERDLIDGTGNEGCCSVVIAGKSVKSGLRNCTISKSPGFNIGFCNTNRKVAGVKLSGITSGGLDDVGAEVEELYAYRSDYTNVSNIGSADGCFWFGNIQGFGGYLYLSGRVYNVYFYDADKTLISILKNCIQYYKYPKPEKAAYARVVFWQASAPTSGDPDYGAVAHLHSYDKPERCFVSNCKLEDNYSTAIAPNGGESMVIEHCVFKNNGYRDPASHLDWEDGRQHNKGHILRYNTFDGGGAVTAVSADGLSIHNNKFIGVPLTIGDEAQNSRIWLNTLIGGKVTITPKTDEVFSQNIGYDGATFTINTLANVGFAVRQAHNEITE